MRTELLDPRTDERWEEFVERAERATMFHHPAWLELLAARYRYDFAASCLVDDDGRVVAGLPWARIESRLTGRRLVALPFSDACPPLIEGASAEELARAIDEHRREAGLGLEVRWLLDSLSDGVAFIATGATPCRSSRTPTRSRSGRSRASAAGRRRRGARGSRSSGAPISPRSTPSTASTCGRAGTRACRRSRSGSSTGSCRCSSAGTGSSRSFGTATGRSPRRSSCSCATT